MSPLFMGLGVVCQLAATFLVAVIADRRGKDWSLSLCSLCALPLGMGVSVLLTVAIHYLFNL